MTPRIKLVSLYVANVQHPFFMSHVSHEIYDHENIANEAQVEIIQEAS